MKQANLQGADIKRVTIRIPVQLHARLARSADAGDRSINSEILAILNAVLPNRTAAEDIFASSYLPFSELADSNEKHDDSSLRERSRSSSLA